MTPDPQRAHDLLEHIAHAIDRINDYTRSGEDEFLKSALIQDAVIRNLEIIGEASRSIEKRFPEFAEQHPEIPLRNAYEMRNVLSHGYFKVDLAIVWRTIEGDLPDLKRQIEDVLKQLEDP